MLDGLNSSNYEVSPKTMAIIAVQNENGTVNSKVMEEHTEYVVHISPTKMIEYACQYFGSSFQGRLDGTRDVCGFTYKAPITINPASGMYFFPTSSPNDKKCSWLSHSHIERIVSAERQLAKVIFKNGKSIVIDASFGSMTNQLYRTAQFRYLLNERLHGYNIANNDNAYNMPYFKVR